MVSTVVDHGARLAAAEEAERRHSPGSSVTGVDRDVRDMSTSPR